MSFNKKSKPKVKVNKKKDYTQTNSKEQNLNKDTNTKKNKQLSSKINEKKKSKSAVLKDIYIQKILYGISKGANVTRNPALGEGNIQLEYDRYYTHNKVVRMYSIESLKEEEDKGLFQHIKQHMDNSIPNSNTRIIIASEVYNINFNSKDLKHKLKYWNRILNAIKVAESEQTEVAKVTEDEASLNARKGIRRMMNSFQKLRAYTRKGRKVEKATIFIQGICDSDEAMEQYHEELEEYLGNLELLFRPIVGVISDFLKGYFPASLQNDTILSKKVNKIVLTDVDNAELMPYTQGVVGNVGIYVGTDIETGNPVFISFTESAKAQNVLVCAKSGEGKSFLLKALLLFHSVLRHRIAIMDYEGKEYDAFVAKTKGKKISMLPHDAVCVNTLKIGNVRGLSLPEAKVVLQDSLNATSTQFKILFNDVTLDDDVDALFDDIINYLYIQAGVERDIPTTYIESHKLHYFDIYEAMKNMESQPVTYEKHKKVLDTALKRLQPYWSSTGSKRYLFEKEITIDDIKDSNVIQFSFGMGASTDMIVPPKETLLKITMMTYIFKLYNQYNYSMGYYTVNIVEEFQRAKNNPMLLKTYNHWFTGGRKENLICYLVTNSIKALTNENNDDAIAIKENITTKLIGKLSKTARQEVIDVFELQALTKKLNDVSLNPRYKNHFVLDYDTGKTVDSAVVYIDIPKHISDSAIFVTRRVESDDDVA